MNNSTPLCSTSETFNAVSQIAYYTTYYGIAAAYVIFGLLGHIVALLAYYKQCKSQQAYLYQVVCAINDVMVLLTQTAYVFGHEICAGVDGHGGCLWYKKVYVLMWFEAHISVPLTNAFFTTAVLLALSTTADRVFALAHPFRYKNANHACHQAIAVTFCYLIGIAVNISDCLLLYPGVGANGAYVLRINSEYSASMISSLTWYSRNLVLLIGIASLATCNGLMLYFYRKRNQKMGAITASNLAKEAERKAQEKALIVLAVSQSVLNFISAGALISYYAGMLFVPSFLSCYDVLCSPLLDATQMSADMLEFYVALALSKQLRKVVAEMVPCMRRVLVGTGTVGTVNVQSINLVVQQSSGAGGRSGGRQ